MAEIRPFKGYRYVVDEPDISALCCPPYDVISDEQRALLATRDARNAVGVELATGPADASAPHNRYENAAAMWEDWKKQGIVATDKRPAYYLLEQCFEQGGRSYRRISVIAELKLHDFEEKVVLPHEHTLPKALGDRYQLLQATNVNFSLVFGLYVAAQQDDYDAFIADAKALEPASTAIDDDGVVTSLRIIDDETLRARFEALLADRQVFIADGHHRYTVALSWRDAVREQRYGVAAGQAPLQPGFGREADSEYVMMALSNMEDPQLLVLPYNRAARMEGDFDRNAFLSGLGEHFEVVLDPTQSLDTCSQPAFLIGMAGEEPLLARLRPEKDMDELITTEHSSAWKHLDVAALQELVLGPLFGIGVDRPETLGRLTFSKDAEDLLDKVDSGAYDVAFLLRPTRMEQLREVSLSGETMPQKSTYFYPKLPTGFVYRELTCDDGPRQQGRPEQPER